MSTNQEKIDALPDHLKFINFKPWHFYYNTKAKKGVNQMMLGDNFIDEVMREQNIAFIPEITRVIPYGDKLYVEAKVIVYNEQRETTAFASITQMPHAEGQTHYAQLAITRALKTALIRHLGISDHDVLMVIDAYGFDMKTIKAQSMSSNDVIETEETTEKEQEITEEAEVDLNLGL